MPTRFVVPAATRRAIERLKPGSFDRARDKALRLFVVDFVRTGQENSPVTGSGRTGQYLKLWYGRVSGAGVAVIGNDAGHAGYVEENTKPHIIRPKNGKALAWRHGMTGVSAAKAGKVFQVTAAMKRRRAAGTPKKGDWTFLKEVHHPGTTGQHIFRRTWEKRAPFMIQQFVDAVNAELSAGPS